PPLGLRGEIVDLGTTDVDGEPETSLVLVPTDAPRASAPPLPRGRRQRELLAALRVQPAGTVWTLADLREIGRRAGMSKTTAHDAVTALTESLHLVATVGGWRLDTAEPGSMDEKSEKR